MINDIQQIANLGGTVVTVVLFLYFLQKIMDRHERISEKFNVTIQSFLKDSNKINQELALKLQQFSNTNKELSEIIKKMYIELIKKRKTILEMKNNQTGRLV